MIQDNIIPRNLLLQAHDLSEYLGHTRNVYATIDIKIGSSHFYFSVDRRYEEYISEQRRKPKKKTPSDYRRDSVRKNKYQQEKDIVSQPLNKVDDDKLLLDCSFISDCPLTDIENKHQDDNVNDQEVLSEDENAVENTEVSETLVEKENNVCSSENSSNADKNENTPKNFEVPNENPLEAFNDNTIQAFSYNTIETFNDKPPQIEGALNVEKNNAKDAIPQILSPITSPKQNYQTAKKSKKKERNGDKIDVNFYICGKSAKSAETKIKSALNRMDKFMGTNVSTAPILLGLTAASDYHFVFSTKIRKDKYQEFLQNLETVDLSSWNVIGGRVGDVYKNGGEGGIDLKNTRHANCGYTGEGPI